MRPLWACERVRMLMWPTLVDRWMNRFQILRQIDLVTAFYPRHSKHSEEYVCECGFFFVLILSLLTTLVTISLQGCTRWVFPCYPFFTSSSIYLLAGFHFYTLEMHSLHSTVCEREPLFARFNQKIVQIRWWIMKIGWVTWKKRTFIVLLW